MIILTRPLRLRENSEILLLGDYLSESTNLREFPLIRMDDKKSTRLKFIRQKPRMASLVKR